MLHHMGLAHGGFLGVDVFFVLSGFLITSLLIKEQRQNGRIALGRFYFRRALRLYPALLVVAAFVVTVAVVANQAVRATLRDAALAVGYVANLFQPSTGLLDHAWTLALEEQFYLVWPLLMVLAVWRAGRFGYLPAVVLIGLVLLLDLVVGREGPIHSYVRAMGLPLGCALALSTVPVRNRLAQWGWPCAAVLLVVVFLPLPFWLTTGWPVSVGALLAVPIVALLVSRPAGLLAHPALRYLGLRSYSLYLWHFPLLALAIHHAPGGLPYSVRVASGAAAGLVTAELSFRLVERPILRYRDKPERPNEDHGRDGQVVQGGREGGGESTRAAAGLGKPVR